MNYSIDKDERISQIRAIPLLAGVKCENVVIKMKEMPNIPDQAMTAQEMGEFMDSYKADVRDSPQKSTPNNDFEKKWQEMKKEADADVKKLDDEYAMLIDQIKRDDNNES